MEEPRWTLDELAERVDAALAVDYHGQSSGRVRDVPDRRAIRWYTTIGLIDRPVAHRGRTALYGPRHLLQLVAVKRLQARGLPLVAIQQELAGATDSELGRVARVPTTAATAPQAAPPEAAQLHAGPGPSATVPARRAAFWREPPIAALTAGAAGAADTPGAAAAPTDPATAIPSAADSRLPPTAGMATLRGIRLADGATLLLEPGRDLDADDLRAVHDAAQPLIAVLRARRLGGIPAPPRAAGGESRREHQ
jgi:hypothetical protein